MLTDVRPETLAVLREEHIFREGTPQKRASVEERMTKNGSVHIFFEYLQSQVKVTVSRDARHSVKATPICRLCGISLGKKN